MTKLPSARSGLLALTLALSCKGGDGGVAGVLVVSSVDVQPGITDVVLGQTRQLSATPKTSSGITVPGRAVSWSSTDPLIASVSSLGLVSGAALGGPVRIRATVDGVVGDALITVRPVPVDRVTVTPTSSPVLVNGSVQLTASAFDVAGAPLSGRTFLWESSAPAIAAVTTTGIVIGLAQGGPVTISAISEGKTGTATVSVSTRPATRLAFAEQPGASVAGLALTPPIRIALQDDLLSTVLGATNPVTIALAGNPGNATLGGTTTVGGINGIATFTNLTLNRVATGYTFLVTSPGLAPATSTPFNVAAGAANQLGFTTPLPASAQSGVAFSPQPVLQLLDAVGNPVAQGGVVITATIASGAGAVGGTTSATTSAAGVATFNTLSLSGAAGSYTLSFAAPGLTALVSGPIMLGSGAAASLAIMTQPTSSAQSGVPLSQQPSVQLKDGSGNTVAQAGVVITATIASGGGALGGATSATTNAGGLAQFTSLAINGPSGSYTLGFSSPGVTGATSTPIILGAGASTQLAIITQPSSAGSSGVALAQQPTVQIRDGSGNPVAVAGVQVTASITSGGGALLGTATVTTNASGNAVFTNLGISGTVGGYTLTFSSSGLTSVVSETITLSAGPAAQLGLATQPSAAGGSGVAFAQQPVVQIRDAAGNSVAQGGVLVTATIASGPGGGTLGGTTTATTNDFGAATFTNLSITGPSGTYTLQFTAPGLTLVTSSGVTLGAGAATQLAITTHPSSTAQSGAAFAVQPALQLRDAANNPVAQAGVVVTATIASGGGTLGGTTTATTNGSGVATFTNLSITGVAGARTLAFSATGLTGATSSTITLSAGAATQLSIATPPSNLAQSGVAFAQQPAVQLRDAAGNAVSQAGVNVTAAIASGGGTLGGTATVATDAGGLATFSGLSITGTAGDRTLGFSSAGLTGATSSVITVTAGAASQLAITTQPSGSAQSGVAFAQQPVIQLRDASNNPVSQAGVVVTASISSGGGTLGGTATATTNGSGVATFTNLSITGPAGDRTLLFTAPAFTSITSGTITITAGGATQLTITTQPSASAQSGVAFAQQPVIQLRDASSNPVNQAGVVVTAAIASGGGTLGGTATATTNASGVATFSNLSISGTAGNGTLTFSAPGLTSVTSATINVTAGPASQLSITTQPSASAQSGVAFAQQPVIQLRDAASNAVSQAGVVVTAVIASGGGTLGGATTATTNASGVATFTNLSISGTTGNRTLTFSAPGVTSVTSATINVTAGPASQLTITTQPSGTAQSGVVFAQQPVLQLRDASNNAVSQSGVAVTASIATGPAGTLGGATTVTTDPSGVASFANLSLSGPPGSYTLGFASAGLTSATSSAITLSAGAGSTLSITTQPSATAQNGAAFAQQPVIQLRDASNNPVTTAGVVVTAAISSGGGTLGGTTTATTNGSGVATFSNLSISGTVGGRTLIFTASGFTSVTSNTITVTAGAATQLSITTQPSASAQSGVAFGQQPLLQLRDASGNSVSQAGVVVTAVIASGGGTLGGTAIATTNASGVATFTNLSIAGAIGNRTLSFSAPSLTGATSATITITPGPASQLTITTQPSGTAQSGVVFAQQPVLQLRDASNNAVSQSGVAVTASIATGPAGTLGGATTVTTDPSGVASFANLSLSGPPGSYTLGFASAGLTSATSSAITLSAGAGSTLSITTQPSATAQNGAAFAQQPVIQLRDGSNNPVAQAGIVVTATIQTGGGTLGGTLTATTNASGVATFTTLSITGTVGDRTLLFAAAGYVSVASGTITITAGPATQLSVTTQPSATAPSGAAFAQQPVLQLRDASSNPVSQAGVVVTAVIASGGGTLGGTLTATTSASGVATFTNLSITGTIGNRTLGFSAPSLTGTTSGTINITAGAAAQLTITTQPSSSASSGVAFPQQPVIQLRDGGSNAISQAGVVVTATIASGGGTLGGTLTATTNASGVATFTNLQISGAPGNFTLGFAATGLTGATSATIAVSASAATQLSITTQPSATAQNGAAFAQQPVLQLRDAANNGVSQAGVVVTAIIASGGGTLGGTLTATTNAGGVATFTNLSITGTIGNRTLGFSAPSLTGATSGTINIIAGAAAIISANSVTTQSATVSTAVGAPPSIKVTDTGTNPIAGVQVTFAVTAGGGTVVPAGPATVTTNASGMATATSWTLGATAGSNNNTVTATAAGLTGSPVSFTASGTTGGATQLTYNTQPSTSAASGAPFAQQPALLLRDAGNNPVGSASVTATITGAPVGVSLVGSPTAITTGSGIATFVGLGLTGPIGNYTLTFTANGGALSSAATNSIALSAGAAAIISANSVTTQSAVVSTAVAAPPSVKVTDTGTNPIAGVAVTFAVTAGGGTVVPAGPATVTTNASGIATATSWTLGATAGTNNNTVTATAAGLTGSPVSFTASGTAGPATQLTYNTQPSTSAASGAPFAQQPALLLRDAGNNPVGSASVTATITGAPVGVSLVGTVTATTNGSGVATFSGLGLQGPAGNYTLTFTANGGALSSAASNSIALSAGAAAIISANSVTSQSATVSTAVGAPPSVKVTDSGTNPIAGVAVTFAVTAGGGTVVPAGPATVTTNASGIATATSWTLGATAGTNNNTVTATAAGLTGSPVSFTASGTTGGATQLTITTQPSAAAASGAQFAQQPVIQLRDSGGNPVSTNGVSISAAINTGVGVLGGALVVTTNASRVATFTNLAITGPGTYTLKFTSGALTQAVSITITIS